MAYFPFKDRQASSQRILCRFYISGTAHKGHGLRPVSNKDPFCERFLLTAVSRESLKRILHGGIQQNFTCITASDPVFTGAAPL